MSLTNSPAETPDFAAAAETQTASEQTAASVSSDSLLTDRRSGRSSLSWSIIRQSQQEQRVEETPMNVEVTDVGDRSRAPKRSESRANRAPYPSKSPKRSGKASSSGQQQLSADQRLEQMLQQHNMEVTSGERGRIVGTNLVGSPPRRNINPSMALQMSSPPRELTRTFHSEPQHIPITDVTSDENGRNVVDPGRDPNGRRPSMSREISELTQRQLTSEVIIAEMYNQRVEAEVHQRNLEQELSQEVHMFNHARTIINEMQTAFNVEDQGCIRRIEMLEAQRNEYATGLVELGNQAEFMLQERNIEYSEELARVKQRSEAYVGYQDENISRMRHELTLANDELQQSNQNRSSILQTEREMAHMNEMMKNETSIQRANIKNQESEISLMQSSMRDRLAIFNSEISNLQSTIQNQRELQIQRSGFTEEEVMSFIRRKIDEANKQSESEIMRLNNTLQSEYHVARMHRGRFDDITKGISDKEPTADDLVQALKDRLDREASYIDSQEVKINNLKGQLADVQVELYSEKREITNKEKKNEKILKELSDKGRNNRGSEKELQEKDRQIEYLESETDRLRDDRNEQREFCQLLYEELWGSEEYPEHEEAETGKTERAEAGRAESSDKSKISRKEADKVVVPPWPKSHDLDGSKSQLLSNVLSACADTDQEVWISWLNEAFVLNPDISGMSNSGGSRFTTIDVKLANALNAMIASSGDSGKEIAMDIKVMTLNMARKNPPEVVRGRQIVAMILDSFRSATHTDLAFTGKHLYELTDPGDNKLSLFKSQWVHILSAMREDDKPRGLALRDILFDKIKGSTSMAFDIRYYKKNPEGHPEKTYEYLMEMINRTIATEREEKNRLEKLKGVNQIVSNPKALAAEKPGKKENQQDNTKAASKATNESAAPVVPRPPQKEHNDYSKGKGKYEKGKGKGKNKDKDKSRGRSPSVDRKTIPCVYHFQKGGCSKGKDCPFSHSKKKWSRGSSSGPGNGKGNPKNDRSASPKPKSEKPCFLFAKGQCNRTDCPYKHDNSAAPAESGSAKAQAAAPKGKAKAAAAKAKAAAVVVQVKREAGNGYLSDWSDNEESSPVAAGKVYRMRRTSHVVKDKVVKIRRKPETIHIDVDMNTTGLPKRTKKRENKPRYVKGEFLESETFKHQTAVNRLIARAKAKVLNNEIMGRKPEIKVIIGKGMYVGVRWKDDEALEEMMKMSNKKNKVKNHSCASAEPSNKSVRFIMDTGCGHDLISQRKVKELELETFLDNDGMTFMTANGLTDSNEITIMNHEGLGQCKLHVLNQAPAVLSVGSRCSKEGYSFIWPKGEDMKPAMISDDGICTFLEVDGDIPYLIPGHSPRMKS